MTAIATRDFELSSWQLRAADAWERGDDAGPQRGTLEIVTGGGKTLIALECVARSSRIVDDLRVAIVVPTEALARQWIDVARRHTDLSELDIGLLGAGRRDDLRERRLLVAVLNSASKHLPDMARSAQPLMLVVDECHRAGAPSFSKVLTTPARFRLGLSATPDREELDEDGEPIEYDEQLVGRSLGAVVHRFDLRDARLAGWLPDYEIHHHAVTLGPEERQEYEALSRRVDDLGEELRSFGADVGRAMQLRARPGELGDLARSYVAATTRRKDHLYRAKERGRVASAIVAGAASRGRCRMLLFHERVDDATILAAWLAEPGERKVALEHSRLPDSERRRVLAEFRTGAVEVLVSVKSLIEGVDVPDADVGISVASSASVRQRVQSLGRVLRRRFSEGGAPKHAEMHVLYVDATADESIYAKEDWSDLTGDGANRYWHWPLGAIEPDSREGPPATPKPTEAQEWERLGEHPPTEPVAWLGAFVGQEYSVDTLGTVTNASGTVIANAQGVGAMVTAVRGRPGGRFRVTPVHRVVLIRSDADGTVFAAGALTDQFVAAERPVATGDADLSGLTPGDRYVGPDSQVGGTFKLSQKRGGVIERRTKSGTEFAATDNTGRPELEANARTVLDTWRRCFDRGITFHVNELDHAWCVVAGEHRFLGAVPGGFAWPSGE